MKHLFPCMRSGLCALLLGTSLILSANWAVNAQSVTRGTDNIPTMHSDWNSQDEYWRNNYTSRPYYQQGEKYESYQPAYRYGSEVYDRYEGEEYGHLDEKELRQGWESYERRGDMSWDRARDPVRDSYMRRGMYDNNSVR